jgi:hypothetical protein
VKDLVLLGLGSVLLMEGCFEEACVLDFLGILEAESFIECIDFHNNISISLVISLTEIIDLSKDFKNGFYPRVIMFENCTFLTLFKNSTYKEDCQF